ncbi:MAG: hypothetical protein IJK45_01295 [Bacteroidaceae bacterium]|nr:hypothetical protein [Bacteroidaceae bacterium]
MTRTFHHDAAPSTALRYGQHEIWREPLGLDAMVRAEEYYVHIGDVPMGHHRHVFARHTPCLMPPCSPRVLGAAVWSTVPPCMHGLAVEVLANSFPWYGHDRGCAPIFFVRSRK